MPCSTPDGIKPEWYFFFVYYPLELLPFWLVMLALLIALAVLFLTSSIFRTLSRRNLSVLAAAAAIYLVVVTLLGQQIHDFIKGGP